ncbi:MAG: putative permease [Rhodobacteraceae bacterium HLUCCA12]|nr:MAG: putative permease [Rhodobacteraceae bacterium HLUCCA12]
MPDHPAPPAEPQQARQPTTRRSALPISVQVVWWVLALIAVLALMWLLSDVLLPFLVGAAMAYFLDPVVRKLHGWGVPRIIAAGLTTALLLGWIVLLILLLVPMLVSEGAQLVREVPDLLERAKGGAERLIASRASEDMNETLRDLMGDTGDTLRDNVQTVLTGVFYGVSGIARMVLFWVVMPVVAFYLLNDWPRLVRTVDNLLPREHVQTLRQLARQIDQALAGFVRGQVLVVLILAAYYGLALSLSGLNYGLLVGVIAGLVSFVPYVGAFVGGTLAIGLALFQFWGDLWAIALVAGIFFLGQFVEGNVLVPKLVGDSVNLHPVWLIFALMALGSLFGLVGGIAAVPVAAALGVLIRFAKDRYCQSALYRGEVHLDRE